MMHLMEPLFDTAYLGLVIALGFRLLLEKGRVSKRFGLMALVLGFGDAFHLLPRILSNLTENGFEKYIFLLSWGEFVTSITMTLFYVIFFHHFRELCNDTDRRKAGMVYVLAALRLAMLLMPQNGWGAEGDYLFGLWRNLPFAILGLLLIFWTWKYRKTRGLQYASLLIGASFLFYLPVVAGARFVPQLGLLMIPKTIAYVLLVAEGFQYCIREFRAENILKNAVVFLILGLVGGVFYREFTRWSGWTDKTALSLVHVHLIALGFMVLLALYAALQGVGKDVPALKRPMVLYITGLAWTVSAFVVRGLYTITSPEADLFPEAALSGMAGLGHMLLVLGILWLMLCLIQIRSERD